MVRLCQLAPLVQLRVFVLSGLSQSDVLKNLYMELQQQMDNPFADATTLDAEIMAAIEWQAARSPEEVMRTREQMTVQLEKAGRAQWDAGVLGSTCTWVQGRLLYAGMVQHWYQHCDDHVRRVACNANGKLLAEILRADGYCDVGCVELLRQGADMIGPLVQSGKYACARHLSLYSVLLLSPRCRHTH